MEWESDSHCCSHTYPRQGHRSPGRCSSWESEFRDCGAIPEWGLLLTAERQIEGKWGRRLWWKVQQPCIVGGAITIASLSPHASIGNWTIDRLVQQTSDSLNYRVGPCTGCSFKWLMCQTKEYDHTQGSPSMYVTTEKDPRQGSPLSAWMGWTAEKDWPKRPSNCQLQEARKKTLIGT